MDVLISYSCIARVQPCDFHETLNPRQSDKPETTPTASPHQSGDAYTYDTRLAQPPATSEIMFV